MKFKLKFILFISFLALIIGFFLFSESTKNYSIIGKYKSVKYGQITKTLENLKIKTSWAMGTTLDIANDSTFEMSTCGSFLRGKWKKKNDSLYLYEIRIQDRNDSLKLYGIENDETHLLKNQIKYSIDGDKLLRTVYIKKNISEKRVRMNLEKTSTDDG